MSDRVHLDLETYSEEDLKKSGLYKYAEHESTDIVVASYAFNEGPVHVWLPWNVIPKSALDSIREKMPKDAMLFFHARPPASLLAAFNNTDTKFVAHNASFERIVLRGTAGKRYGLPEIPITRWICTMAKAAVHGLPHSLEGAANALGTFPKRKIGVNEMRYLSKPRKDGTRPTAEQEPERLIETTLYNIDDVIAERDLDNHIPNLTGAEEQIYFLDQRINDRGVRIDQPAIHDIMYLVEQYRETLKAWMLKATAPAPGAVEKAQAFRRAQIEANPVLTGDELDELQRRDGLITVYAPIAPTQTGKLADWLRTTGEYPQLKDLQAPTVVECLADEFCPPLAKKVLKCYSIYAGKAVSKFDAMLRSVCKDGRIHGMFMYYGAGPGRWSSRIVQLQNMLRSLLKWQDVDTAITACKMRSLDYIKSLFDLDPMKVFASCSRGVLIPAEGHDFLDLDFSQIEAAIQAWLSGTEWKLQVMREGKIKIYQATGAQMFGTTPEAIGTDGPRYIAAKIGELACGYQGWKNAVEKMARQNGMVLSMPADEIAGRWRDANPLQVYLWGYLEDAAAAAVKNPGKAYAIPNKKIMFKVEGRWLYMRLPSGRRIAYLDPEIHDSYTKVDEPDEQEHNDTRDGAVTYMGVDTYTRQWKRVNTYGGKLLQNACEGIGRDLLVSGLQQMESAGYATVMTAHDAGTFENPEGFGSLHTARQLFTVPLAWASGLPVKAGGWRGKRYRK